MLRRYRVFAYLLIVLLGGLGIRLWGQGKAGVTPAIPAAGSKFARAQGKQGHYGS